MTAINKKPPLNNQMLMGDIKNTKKITVDGSAVTLPCPGALAALKLYHRGWWVLTSWGLLPPDLQPLQIPDTMPEAPVKNTSTEAGPPEMNIHFYHPSKHADKLMGKLCCCYILIALPWVSTISVFRNKMPIAFQLLKRRATGRSLTRKVLSITTEGELPMPQGSALKQELRAKERWVLWGSQNSETAVTCVFLRLAESQHQRGWAASCMQT